MSIFLYFVQRSTFIIQGFFLLKTESSLTLREIDVQEGEKFTCDKVFVRDRRRGSRKFVEIEPLLN